MLQDIRRHGLLLVVICIAIYVRFRHMHLIEAALETREVIDANEAETIRFKAANSKKAERDG